MRELVIPVAQGKMCATLYEGREGGQDVGDVSCWPSPFGGVLVRQHETSLSVSICIAQPGISVAYETKNIRKHLRPPCTAYGLMGCQWSRGDLK